MIVTAPGYAATASLTTNLATTDSNLTFAANTTGTVASTVGASGDNISIVFVVTPTGNVARSITTNTTTNTITVTLGSTAGVVNTTETTTAIAAAINADPNAQLLVNATVATSDADGLGLVTAMNTTNLLGGANTTTTLTLGNTTAGGGSYNGTTSILADATVIMGNSTSLGNSTLQYNTGGGTLSFGTLASATLGGLAGSLNLPLLSGCTSGTFTLSVGGNNNNTTYSGVLSGALGNLTKNGGGTLTLTSNNTFTGIINLNGGLIQVGNLAALGSNTSGTTTAASLTMTNGGFEWAPNYLNTSGDNGDFTFRLGTPLGGTTPNFDNSTGSNTSITNTLNTNGNNITLADNGLNTVTGNTNYTFNKTGNGTLTLAIPVTINTTGTTTGGSGPGGDTSGVMASNGGTLQLGNFAVAGGLPVTGGTTIGYNMSDNANITLEEPNSITISGIISGFGNFTQTSTGGQAANLTTTVGGGNNSITYTAASGVGTAGNSINITYVNPGTANATGNLVVSGNNITVNLATNAAGAVTTTAANIISMIGNSSVTNGTAAGNLVTAAVAATDLDGAGNSPVAAMNTTPLGGGAIASSSVLTLASNNTINGSVIINGGTIAISNNNSLQNATLVYNAGTFSYGTLTNFTVGGLSGSQNIPLTNPTIGGGETLTVNGFQSPATYSGVLFGTGTLVKSGTGILTLNGANTYSGGTLITGGEIDFNSASNFGTGNIVLFNGGLQWAPGTSTDISSKLVGPFGGFTSNITFGSGNDTLDTNGNNVTFASALTGNGTMIKAGAGTLTLTQASQYTGGTIVSAGLINFNSLNNFGTGNISLKGGGLQWAPGTNEDISSQLNPVLNGFNATFATTNVLGTNNGIVFSANGTSALTDGTFGNNITVTFVQGSGSANIALSLAINGTNYTVTLPTDSNSNAVAQSASTIENLFNTNATANASIVASNAPGSNGSGNVPQRLSAFLTTSNLPGNNNGVVFAARTSGTGGDNITVTINQQTGSANLAPNLTISGTNYTINLGTDANGNPNTTAATVESLINTNGTANGTIAASNAFGSTGSGIISTLATANLTNGGTATLAGGTTNTLDTNGNSITLSANLSGPGGIVKAGNGTLLLSGINTYTGPTSVAAGTLALGNSLSLENSTLTLVAGGGTLNFGSLTNATFGGLAGNGSFDLSNSNSTALNLIVGTNNLNTTFNGTISDTNSYGGTITKVGNGTLTLASSNTYTGQTFLNGGAIQFNNNANFGTGNLVINNATLIWAAGVTSGVDISQILNTNATGGLASGIVTFNLNSNDEALTKPMSGSAGLNIVGGAGILTLSGGQSTYMGNTTVTSGTLALGNGTSTGGNLSGNIAMGNSTSLFLNQSTATTLSGLLTGPSSSGIQINPGILAVNATNLATPNSNLLFRATSIGASSDGISIQYVNPDANAQPLTINVTNTTAVWTSGSGTSGITLTANTNIGNGASAAAQGIYANGIAIQYVNGTGNGTPTTASVTSNATGSLITVTLGTNGSGVVNATANNVITAILNNATVAALVVPTNTLGNNGSGQVTAGTAAQSIPGATAIVATLATDSSGTLANASTIFGNNNDLMFTANGTNATGGTIGSYFGSAGNAITVTYQLSANASTTVSVSGTNITVSLKSGGDTAANVAAAIAANPQANALVTVANAGNSNGLGQVSVLSPLTLTGGVDPNLITSGTALAAALNSNTTVLTAGNGPGSNGSGDVTPGNFTLNGGVSPGNNPVTISGINTFAGNVTLGNGTLTLGNSLALQDAIVNANAGGGSLSFGTLTAATLGGLGGTGSIALANTTDGAVTLTLGQGNASSTFSGVITGNTAGNGSLIKVGSGTLTLTGFNTFTGGVVDEGGLIDFNSIRSFGNGGANSLTLLGGGIQWAANTSTNIAGILNPVLNTGPTSDINTFDTNGNNITLSAALSGVGSVLKKGSGVLTLTGNNTYLGATTISAGTLQLGNGTLSGFLVNSQLNNFANLTFDEPQDVVYSALLTGNGSLTQLGSNQSPYSLTTALSAGNVTNSSLSFLAANTGVTVAFVNGTGNNAATTAAITGNAITVTLGTNGSGVVNATAAQVLSVLTAGPNATSILAKVTPALANGSLGNGTASALLTTSLTGPLYTVSTGNPTTGSGLTYVANNTFNGSVGAGISVIYKNGANNTATTTAAVSGNAITITLATNATGVTNATAAQVLSVLTGGPNATSILALVTPTLTGGNQGTNGTGLAYALSTGTVSANTALTYTATSGFSGSVGGNITIQYVNGTGNSVNTTAAVNTTTDAIVVTLGTNSSGVVNATPAQVIAAISANTTVAALVTAANTTGSNGNGTLAALGATNLTGPSLVVSGAGLVTGSTGNGTINTLSATPTNLILTGNNTFSGTTQITGGTLDVGTTLALQNTTLVFNGTGNLAFGFANSTVNYTVTSANIGMISASSGSIRDLDLINNQGGAVNLTLGATPANPSATYNGNITGLGELIKAGTGTLTLGGNISSYSGGTNINQGTILLEAANSTQTELGTGQLIMSGGTLQLPNSSSFDPTLLGMSLVAGTASTLFIPNGTILTQPITGAGPNANITFRDTSGNITLVATSTYNGTSFVGIPNYTNSTSDTVSNLSIGNNTLTVGGLSGTVQLTGNASSGNTSNFSNLTFAVANGSVGLSAPGTGFSGANQYDFSQNITGVGNVNESGSADLVLSGLNFYTGNTTISVGGGNIIVANNNAMTDSAFVANSNSTFTLANGGLLFDSQADSPILGGLSGNASIALKDNVGNPVNLSVGANNGNYSYTGILSGPGSLTIAGTGIFTLSGVQTYTGPTAINFGILTLGNNVTYTSLANSTISDVSSLFISEPNNTGGVFASATTTGNIVFTSKNYGPASGSLNIQFVAGASQNTTTAALSGGNIIVTLANVTTNATASNVISAISANASTAALLSAALATGGNGSAVQVATTSNYTLAGGGAITPASVVTGVLGSNVTVTLSGVISGGGSLNQNSQSAGTAGGQTFAGALLVLNNPNDVISGGLFVTSGNVQLGDGTTNGIFSAGSTVNSGQQLIFDEATPVTWTSIIAGFGSIAQNGTGAVTLTANNTIGGVVFNTFASAAPGDLILGGSLALAYANVTGYNTSAPGAYVGNLNFNGLSAVQLGGLNGNRSIDISNVTLTIGNDNGASVTTIAANGGTASSTTYNVVNSTYYGSLTSNTGPGELIKAGNGTFILANNSTFNSTLAASGIPSTANVTVENGTLQLGQLANASLNVTASVGTVLGNIVVNSPNITNGTIATLAFAEPSNYTFSSTISGTGNVTQAGSATLTFNGVNTYTGNTSILLGTLQVGNGTAGSISLASNIVDNGNLVIDEPGNIVLSNPISGTGNVYIQEANNGNAVTFTAINSYNGNTYIEQNTTLVMGSNTSLQNTTVNLFAGNSTANGTLNFGTLTSVSIGSLAGNIDLALNASNNLGAITLTLGNGTSGAVYSGNLTGPFAGSNFIKTGSSSLTLAGTESFNGNITSNGTLALSGNVQIGTGSLNVLNGTVTLSGANNTYTGGTTIGGNGTVVFNQANSFGTGQIQVNNATLQWNAPNLDISSQLANGVTGGNDTFNLISTSGTSQNVTLASTIGGSGNLYVTAGTASLTLSGANTYSGTTNITNGTLVVNNQFALGGTTLNYGTGTDTGTIQIPTGIVNVNMGGLTLAKPLALNTTTGQAVTLTVGSDNASTTFSAILSGNTTGVGNLTKTGAGLLSLAVNNTYNGTTTVSGGEISFKFAGNYSTYITGTTATSFGVEPNIVLNGGGLQWGGGVTSDLSPNLSISGANTLDTIDTNANNIALLSQALSGTGVLVKNGGGNLTLATTELYNGVANATLLQGTTIISAGALQLGNGSASGIGALQGNITDNAILVFNEGATTTVSNLITGNGSLVQNGVSTGQAFATTSATQGETNTNANITYTAAAGGAASNNINISYVSNSTIAIPNVIVSGTNIIVQLSNNTANNTAQSVMLMLQNSPQVTTLVYPVLPSGSNGSGILVPTIANLTLAGGTTAGTTTLKLANANTFNGTTSISAGTLLLGNPLALQNSTLSYVSGGGVLSFGTLSAATLGGLTGNLNIDLDNTTPAAVALTVGQNNNSTSYSGNLTGNGSLIKSGTGTLTLTGTADTYIGGTNITGGLINFSSNTGSQFGTGKLVLDGGGVQYATNTLFDISSILNATAGLSGPANDTIDTNGNNETFSTVLAGSGTLVKAGAGTLFLSKADTYTGGTIIKGGLIDFTNIATNFNNGVVTLAGGGLQYSASSSGEDISPNITLGAGNDSIDTNGTTETLATSIAGAGTLVKIGAGTLILSPGATTEGYTGGTIINVGTLQLGNGTANGTMNATLPSFSNIQDNASLNFDQAASANFGGIISGTGSVNQGGANTLTLISNNTFTGNTTISSGGTLQTGIAGALQNSTLNYVTSGGNLSFGGLSTAILGGVAGNKDLILGNSTNSGVAVSIGNNNANTTYTGNLAGSNAALTTPTQTNGVNANVVYAANTSNTSLEGTVGNGIKIAYVVTPTGNVARSIGVTGSGNTSVITVTLGSTSGVVNATETAANIAAAINANATTKLLVTAAAQGTGAGLESAFAATNLASGGAGSLIKIGNGTLALTGTDNYQGNTTVNSGTLSLGSAGALPSAGTLIVNNATLLNSSGSPLQINNNEIWNGTLSFTGGNFTFGTTGTPSTVTLGTNTTLNLTSNNITIDDAFAQTGTTGETFAITGAGNLAFGGNGTAVANLSSNLNAPHFEVTGTENITLGSGTDLVANGAAGINSIGFAPNDNITFALTGNAIFSSNLELQVGNVGNVIGGSNITLNISGTSNLTANDLWLGTGSAIDDATSVDNVTVNQTGGTVTLTGTGTGTTNGYGLFFGDQTGLTLGSVSATYNLNTGGVLITGPIGTGNLGPLGLATLNFNGGTLETNVSSLNFLAQNTLSIINVLAGGANINTNGFNITINTSLQHAASLGGTVDGGLTKSGSGTLTFPITLINTYTGNTTLLGGTLNISSPSALGRNLTSSIVFGGNSTLQASANFTFTQSQGIIVNSGMTGTIDTQAFNLTYGGNVTGAGSLAKSGSGELTLTGHDSYSGGTIINAGTLFLNFSTPGAPTTNILNSSAPLVLNGPGSLLVQALQASANSQSFSSTTVNGGSGVSSATLDGAASGSLSLNFGPLSRTTGGVLDLTTVGTGVTFLTSSNGTLNGKVIVGNAGTPFVVVSTGANGVDWGAYNGTTSSALISTVASVGGYTGINSGTQLTGNHSTGSASISTASNLNETSNVIYADLSFLTPGDAPTIDLGQDTMQVGGILVSPAIGNGNNPGITNGTLEPVAAGGDIVIEQASSDRLTLTNVTISNIGSATNLVKAGGGDLDLVGGVAGFTGNTYLDAGSITLDAISGGIPNDLLQNSQLQLQGGTLNVNIPLAFVGGISGNQNIAIGGGFGDLLYLTPKSGTTSTFSGNIGLSLIGQTESRWAGHGRPGRPDLERLRLL